MNEKDLKKKGFVQDANGVWSKRSNAHLGRISKPNAKRPPRGVRKTVVKNEAKKRRAKSVENRPVVTFFSFRQRLLTDESDSFAAGLKYLRDAVAKSIGLDDADEFIDWRYYQTKVAKKSEEGTLVKIEF